MDHVLCNTCLHSNFCALQNIFAFTIKTRPMVLSLLLVSLHFEFFLPWKYYSSWNNLEDLERWLTVREVEFTFQSHEQYKGAKFHGKWNAGMPHIWWENTRLFQFHDFYIIAIISPIETWISVIQNRPTEIRNLTTDASMINWMLVPCVPKTY